MGCLSCLTINNLTSSKIMTTKTKIDSLGLTIIGLILSHCVSLQAQAIRQDIDLGKTGPEAEGYKFTISTTNNAFKLGQQVMLFTSLQNISSTNSGVRVWDGFWNYSFQITGPEGKPVRETMLGTKILRPAAQYHVSWETVPVGTSHERVVPLDLMYEMTNVGEYLITASREVPKKTNQQESVWLPSGSLKIRIIERTKLPASNTDTIPVGK